MRVEFVKQFSKLFVVERYKSIDYVGAELSAKRLNIRRSFGISLCTTFQLVHNGTI
jgi:hypothetical protein